MNRRSHIIASLEKNLDDMVRLFQSLTPEQQVIEVYSDGGRWTVKQVLAHFVTIEQSMHWLFNNILSGGEGSPADFDPDRFNLKQVPKLDGLTLEELLDRLREVRKATLSIVRNMSEADLDRHGFHAFHGQGTLERFIRWAYEHALLHAEDIRRVLMPEDLETDDR